MNKKLVKKLVLSRETLTALADGETRQVVGGALGSSYEEDTCISCNGVKC